MAVYLMYMYVDKTWYYKNMEQHLSFWISSLGQLPANVELQVHACFLFYAQNKFGRVFVILAFKNNNYDPKSLFYCVDLSNADLCTFQFSVVCSVHTRPGPEVIKLFSCSAQLRHQFILLINVKMPTIVGI